MHILCCSISFHLCCSVLCSELADVQRRHHELLDAAQARLAELDTENRQLRDTKYSLDSRVRPVASACAGWVEPPSCPQAPHDFHACSARLWPSSITWSPIWARQPINFMQVSSPLGQVSELSHRLGAAEGANRSLEDQVAKLGTSSQALAEGE